MSWGQDVTFCRKSQKWKIADGAVNLLLQFVETFAQNLEAEAPCNSKLGEGVRAMAWELQSVQSSDRELQLSLSVDSVDSTCSHHPIYLCCIANFRTAKMQIHSVYCAGDLNRRRPIKRFDLGISKLPAVFLTRDCASWGWVKRISGLLELIAFHIPTVWRTTSSVNVSFIYCMSSYDLYTK